MYMNIHNYTCTFICVYAKVGHIVHVSIEMYILVWGLHINISTEVSYKLKARPCLVGVAWE